MMERAIRSPCVTCVRSMRVNFILLSRVWGGKAGEDWVGKRTSTPLMPARMLMLLVQKVDSIDM